MKPDITMYPLNPTSGKRVARETCLIPSLEMRHSFTLRVGKVLRAVTMMSTATVVACGGNAGSDSAVLVTPADVTGLPAGDARGQARTGSYAVQTADAPSTGSQSCFCRVGTCAALDTFDRWWIVSLVENDGAVSMSPIRGGGATFPCAGGINVGGDFWCGKNDGSTLARLDGQIISADGQVTGLTMTSRELIRVTDDGLGQALDCDVRQSATFFFAN